MPIKDLTDQIRFPRLGKVHLGVRAKKTINGREVEYPKPVDYFVCGHPAFQEFYPGQPKELDIAFPTEDPEHWASQFYRAYTSGRGLTCKGDGEKANRLVLSSGLKDGNQSIAPHDPTGKLPVRWIITGCPGRDCEYYKRRSCQEVMMLQFLLPHVSGLGIWQLDTSSINSIRAINSAVTLIKNVVGHISLLPLKLRVVPLEVSPEGQKKTVYVLQLDVAVRLAELGQHLMLPEPEDEMPEDLYPTEEQEQAAAAPETKIVEETGEIVETKEPAPADEEAPNAPLQPPPVIEPMISDKGIAELIKIQKACGWNDQQLEDTLIGTFGVASLGALTLTAGKEFWKLIRDNPGGPPEPPAPPEKEVEF